VASSWEEQFPSELLSELRDSRVTLPAFGKILDQETGEAIPYDPDRISPALQHTFLSFYGDPPRDADGRRSWLCALSSRQVGKSWVGAAGNYTRTAYTPGAYSAIIADIKERAEDLFRNITMLHESIPDAVRMPTIPNRESRQLTFLHGGKIRTLSAESNMVGIGRAVDNLHMCLAPDTPVWAEKGLVAIEDLEVGDLVRTHTGAIAPVKRKWTTPDRPGVRVDVHGHTGFVLCSPEHKWPTARGTVLASDLEVGDELVYPVRRIEGHRGVLKVPRWPEHRRYRNILPATVKADYLWGRVFGLYLAEGHINENRVTFSVHPEEVSRTLEWLEAVGVTCAKVREGRNVRVDSKQLAAFLENYLGRTKDKQFPDEWWKYPRTFIEGLVHGYYAGDGSVYQGDNGSLGGYVTSVLPNLTYTFRDTVAALWGHWCSIQKLAGGKRHGRARAPQWRAHPPAPILRKLAHTKGKTLRPAKRPYRPRKTTPRVEGGKAFIPIKRLFRTATMDMVDIEVDHPDHSFLLAHAATSNSEVPFWANAAEVWNGLFPAFINRREAAILAESTPAPMHHPSAEWYRNLCAEARQGKGRWLFCFVPFYQSRLNERRWGKDWTLTSEEIRLLERFGGPRESAPGAQYLTLENLAFRREVMDNDPEIRRNPELFRVFYPTDPITCWQQAGGAAIPNHALERHQQKVLVPWPTGARYQRYVEPKEGAIYVIGADPAGWMGGDNAAFQVLELWEDRWEQCAVFSSNEIDPTEFAALLVKEARDFNDATVIVENNGVGMGTLAILMQAYRNGDLRNLHFSQRGVEAKPGIAASKQSINKALGLLIDALMDRLVLHDMETVDQLASYRHDKLVEESEVKGILSPGKTGRGRRPKHHWDRVSALLWAVFSAYDAPVKFRPRATKEAHGDLEPVNEKELTVQQWQDHLTAVEKDKARAEREARRAQRKDRVKIGRKKKEHWTKRR
jgi:hypothetical protein